MMTLAMLSVKPDVTDVHMVKLVTAWIAWGLTYQEICGYLKDLGVKESEWTSLIMESDIQTAERTIWETVI